MMLRLFAVAGLALGLTVPDGARSAEEATPQGRSRLAVGAQVFEVQVFEVQTGAVSPFTGELGLGDPFGGDVGPAAGLEPRPGQTDGLGRRGGLDTNALGTEIGED